MDVVRSSAATAGGAWLGVLDSAASDIGVLRGTGVVVGFVDSGIDVHHADFYTEGTPNRTRILALWDQTDAAGPAPAGGYTMGGTEWTQSQLDAEINGSPGTVREKDTLGHGTHVAGIAAGDGSSAGGGVAAGTFAGIASDADIVMVKSDLSDTGILEGVQYIVAKAKAAGERAVINLSIGTQYGPHDGTSTLETGIDAVAASTPVVVAMGNEQQNSVHASATIPASGSQAFDLSVATGSAGTDTLEADFWGNTAGDYYTVVVGDDQTGTTVNCAPGLDCTLSLSAVTVTVYNKAGSHPNGDREMLVNLFKSGGLPVSNWVVTLQRDANGGSGRVDGWVDTDLGSFTSQVDNTMTAASPATAKDVVAVGSYCSKNEWKASDFGTYVDVDCTTSGWPTPATDPKLGDISDFSNEGPTRDGRQKPDLAGPGQRVAAALSADQSPAESATTTTPDGKHKLLDGTSMATPVVSGAVARDLEISPALSASDERAALRAAARSDTKVSLHGAAPNSLFGYGKLDVKTCGAALAVAPSAASALTLGTSSISWTWNALSGATSYRVYYATSPSVLLASPASPAFVQTGLPADYGMALRVTGVNACGEGPAAVSASTATLSAAVPSFTAAPFVSSVTVTWTPQPASSGTLVQASVSAAFTGTVYSSRTTNAALGSLTVGGLTGYTSYYLRVGTLNLKGGPNFLGGTQVFTNTSVQNPGLGAFGDVTASQASASWTLNGNVPGLLYTAYASTASDFTGTELSSATYGLGALFTGLSANVTYYFRVQPQGGPGTILGSTVTLAAAPTAAAVPFPSVYQSSVSAAWTAGPNPAGTRYRAELAADQAFSIGLNSSTTFGTSALFSGLAKNTSYYLRVTALNWGGAPSAYSASAGTSTLTSEAAAGSPVFGFVGASSASVSWVALPIVPLQLACEAYLVQASTRSDFSAPAAQVRTANTASGATLAGLLQDSTYYFRVATLNWDGAPVFTVLGSTHTEGILESSGTVSGDGSYVSVPFDPGVPQLSSVLVKAPAGTFPAGTAVSVVATLLDGFPPPSSNEGTLTALGPKAAVEVSAQGLQPDGPVTLTFQYVASQLPTGADVLRLVVARYADGNWTMLPTTVDPSAQTITAQTTHFSLFAPFLVSQSSSLDAVQVFPIPWMPGSGDKRFDGSGVSFTSLPDGAEIRIFTILGEQVADLRAGTNGTTLWDGNNSSGRRVGSGTYIVVLSGAGKRRVLRVAVVR
ncbi:MAG: S8 family serine peptidase [Elusimicrobia bacterium]|nr:S8 family serine peptidase [Elusimicrobiota bacterium]